MPRKLRIHVPDLPLHLILRGVERRDIFLDDRDREYYLCSMKEAFALHKVRLLADCLMTNHAHALAAPSDTPIGVAMHLLETKFAHYFNNRYGRSGHLFQDRFISIPVRSLGHLVTVADYITDNPVRAGIVPSREQWRWSSHAELMGEKVGRLNLDCLPDVAGMAPEEFAALYRERVVEQEARLASRTLSDMVEEAAALTGLTTGELREGGRLGAFTRARRLVLRWGRPRGYTVPEMAVSLGCTPEALYMLD